MRLYSAQECFGLGSADVLRVVVSDTRNSRTTKIEGFLIRPNKPNHNIGARGAYGFVLACGALSELGYASQMPETLREIKAWLFDVFLSQG